MFDIGFAELLVIGVVALIVVGPKDLPGMFRTLGRFTGKMRNMAREFQRAMNDAADEAGVKDVAKDLKNVTSPKSMGLDKLNAAADAFDKWEPGKGGTRGKPLDRGEKKPPAPETAETAPEAAAATDSPDAKPKPAAKAPPKTSAKAADAAPKPAGDEPA